MTFYNRSLLKFLIYEENLIFFFISAERVLQDQKLPVMIRKIFTVLSWGGNVCSVMYIVQYIIFFGVGSFAIWTNHRVCMRTMENEKDGEAKTRMCSWIKY
jgi:hypothetical protein